MVYGNEHVFCVYSLCTPLDSGYIDLLSSKLNRLILSYSQIVGMSGKMIGIDYIIENEVYTILVFISIKFIRGEISKKYCQGKCHGLCQFH